MDITAQTSASVVATQTALRVIAHTLQLTAYLFPRQPIVENGSTYHFIIVGGGSAGCVVASRLSENENFNVLLIEAGDDPPIEVMLPGLFPYAPHSRLDWNYTSQNDGYTMQCHAGGVLPMIRGHMLGGSSGGNYMYYVRGCPHDYQQWAEIAKDDTWNWTNVFPYFLKSERLESVAILDSPYSVYHGTDGPIGVTREDSKLSIPYLDAIREMGIDVLLDMNGPETVGYSQALYTIAEGVRQSTGYAYISPIKHRPNLHVLRQTEVTKILFSESKRATSVEVITKDGETMVINASKEIILSAGAINSPKLLMLSGIGPKDHLRSLNIETIMDLPVGYNFQDHVVVNILHQMEKTEETTPPSDPHFNAFPSVLGFIALNQSQQCGDYQNSVIFVPHGFIEKALIIYSFDYQYTDEINQILYDSSIGRNLILSVINKLHPNSRGRVMLRSAEPRDPPLIYTGFFNDDSDLEDMLDYIEDYLRIMNTTYFQSVDSNLIDLAGSRCSDFKRGSREYWRCYVLCVTDTLTHHSCTCAMGSVVDSELRVFGVAGLRVADASVMPVITGGNTNIPTIMIAEKVSDMIKAAHMEHV